MDALTGELFSQNGEFLVENQDLWKIPADLVQYLSPQQQELALTVEAYNDFVYEHYTQLPPELEAALQTYLTENHQPPGLTPTPTPATTIPKPHCLSSRWPTPWPPSASTP